MSPPVIGAVEEVPGSWGSHGAAVQRLDQMLPELLVISRVFR